jgi:hypothetical protein
MAVKSREVPTADDALDLVQDTFLRAARTPRSIPSGFAAEEAWLVPVLVTFAAIVIGMVIIASMWPRNASLAQAALRFEVRLAKDQPAPGLRAARVGSSDRTVYLHPRSS